MSERFARSRADVDHFYQRMASRGAASIHAPSRDLPRMTWRKPREAKSATVHSTGRRARLTGVVLPGQLGAVAGAREDCDLDTCIVATPGRGGGVKGFSVAPADGVQSADRNALPEKKSLTARARRSEIA